MEKNPLVMTPEMKEQLVARVQQCLEEDTLNSMDWVNIHEILLAACERKKAELLEELLIQCVSPDEEETE